MPVSKALLLVLLLILTCAGSLAAQDPCSTFPPPPTPVSVTLDQSEVVGFAMIHGVVGVSDPCAVGGIIHVFTNPSVGQVITTTLTPGATSMEFFFSVGNITPQPITVVVTAASMFRFPHPVVQVSTSLTIQPLIPTITFDRAEATDGDFILATITLNDNEGAFIGLETSHPAFLAPIGSENSLFQIEGSSGTVLFQVGEVEQPTPVTVTAVITDAFFFRRGATDNTTVTVCPPAGCSPESRFRIIAQRLDGGARQTRDVDSSGSVGGGPVEFFLGEQFQVQVVEINPDGTDGAVVGAPMMLGARSVAAASPQSQIFGQPTRLFPNNVLIHFPAASPAEFLPVHSGTADILVTVPDPAAGPGATREVTLPVQIPTCPASGSCGFRLGNTHNQFDDDIIRFADVNGIPPQIIKSQIQTESSFNPQAYRYEPLSIDFALIGRSQAQLTSAALSPWRLALSSDCSTVVSPRGSELVLSSSDASPRQVYAIGLDQSGSPMCSVAGFGQAHTQRSIVSTDELISMENIFYNGDGLRQWTRFNDPAPFYRMQRQATWTPFVAQTAIAASYGLHQVLYTTATQLQGFVDQVGAGRPPHELHNPGISLELGSEYLATRFRFNQTNELDAYVDNADFVFQYGPALRSFNSGRKLSVGAIKARCANQPLPPRPATGRDPHAAYRYACTVLRGALIFAVIR